MTLTEPSTIAFFISFVPATVALLAILKVPLPGNPDHAVHVALVGYIILAASVIF